MNTILPVLGIYLACCLPVARASGIDWTSENRGKWETSAHYKLHPSEDRTMTTAVAILPGSSKSLPGEFGAWSLPLAAQEQGITHLRFWVESSSKAPAKRRVLARLRMGDEILWSHDVGSMGEIQVVIPLHPRAGAAGAGSLMVEGFTNELVTNYPVTITFGDFEVSNDGGKTFRGIDPLPVNQSILPDPSAGTFPQRVPDPRNIPPWLQTSRAVQPWGRSQTSLIRNAKSWSKRLRNEFGFNTLILASPDSHRGIVRNVPKLVLTDQEFRDAMEIFRQDGFRILFYASLVHCGHSAQWHEDFGDPSEKIPSRNPEWLQTDEDGRPINRYGGRWLCPLTDALGFQIEYFQETVKQWQPDGLMLDNHGFHFAGNQRKITSYSPAAAKAYADFAESYMGNRPEAPPRSNEPQYPLWLAWRNEAMAGVTHRFREALRATDNNLVISANVAFDYPRAALANDSLLGHLDAVVTENKSVSPADLLAKVAFGDSLSPGIPQWVYLGTFEPKNHELLRSPEWIRDQCASGIASGALPWVVFYGFDPVDETNSQSLRAIANQMHFWQRMQDLQPWGKPLASAIFVVSPRERTFAGRGAPIPSSLAGLGSSGRPVRLLLSSDLPSADLSTNVPLLLDGINCLSGEEANAISRFAKSGGMVIATRDSGWLNPFGQWLPQSRLKNLPAGSLHLTDASRFLSSAEKFTRPIASTEGGFAWFIAYQTPNAIWVHFALHFPAQPHSVVEWHQGQSLSGAEWFFADEATSVPASAGPTPNSIVLPTGHKNFILKINAPNP